MTTLTTGYGQSAQMDFSVVTLVFTGSRDN